MDHRIRASVKTLRSLRETHDEYADSIDLDDIEVREVWDQIVATLRVVSRLVSVMKKSDGVEEPDLEEIETRFEELNDLYAELGALAWEDAAAN